VVVDHISRSREGILDGQYREVSWDQGMNQAMSDYMKSIQSIMGEGDSSGLSNAIQRFFNSAQEMSLHADNIAVRNTFLQNAQYLVSSFRQRANDLQTLQNNLVSSTQTSELSVSVNDVNEKLRALAEINKQIGTVLSVNGRPNDLYDKRDLLLDDLAKQVNYTTTDLPNGQIELRIGNQVMVRAAQLVDTLQLTANPGPAPPNTSVPTLVQTVNSGATLNDGAGTDDITGGRIRGLLDVAGNTGTTSSVRSMMEDLNNVMVAIVGSINALQSTGRDMNGALGAANLIFTPAAPATPPLEIFQYQVNAAVIADPRLIAAAADDATAPGNFVGQGDGRNALAMAQLRNQVITAFPPTPLNTTFEDYMQNTMSQLGADAGTYETRTETGTDLINEIDLRRQSVSGVNIDEEMVDMIRFQRAFEASSKMMKVYDEVVQGIINLI
jgi:flagellar hook-associated protein 1 FlgK